VVVVVEIQTLEEGEEGGVNYQTSQIHRVT